MKQEVPLTKQGDGKKESQEAPQPQPQLPTQAPPQSKPSRYGMTVLVWFVYLCCLAVTGCIFLSPQHDTSIFRGKLFHLLKQEKYQKIQKKLELNQKVILIGDKEEGVNIFVNQFLNRISEHKKRIKVRHYEPGVNLLYRTNNILLRPFYFMKYLLFQSVTPILWVIKTSNSLTLDNLEEIYQFIKDRQADNIIIITEAVPAKASKTYPFFKIIEFKNLDKKEIADYLLRERKLHSVNLENLFDQFGNNLERIDEFIHESEDLDASFAEIYSKQANNLQQLLKTDPRKVERLLKKMCSKGFQRVKEPHGFIFPNNGVIEYFDQEKTYRWSNKKALFAVSDKYDIRCETNIQLMYIDLDERGDISRKRRLSPKK